MIRDFSRVAARYETRVYAARLAYLIRWGEAFVEAAPAASQKDHPEFVGESVELIRRHLPNWRAQIRLVDQLFARPSPARREKILAELGQLIAEDGRARVRYERIVGEVITLFADAPAGAA